MAVITTVTNVKPMREDLADMIYDVSPEDVPFLSGLKHESVDNTIFEWQTDALVAVSATTAAEGADPTPAAATDTVRLQNRTSIISKAAQTSGTHEAVNNAGMSKQMAYQIIRRAKECKRDTEHQIVGNHAPYSGTTTRISASYAAYTNDQSTVGATAGAVAAGTGADIPTGGDARALTETLLGAVIDNLYLAGGHPNIIMAHPTQKRKITGFSGNANNGTTSRVTHDNSDKRVINAVSVYVSDYGDLKVLPNRFGLADEVLVYEQDMWSLGVLRPMSTKPLAKTGDSETRMVVQECAVKCKNPDASGAIFDLS